MKNILISIVCILTVLLAGCSRDVMSNLDMAESYMEEQPEQALALLEDIDRDMLSTRKARARHALLYSMALDKSYIDTTDVEVVMPAVEYYNRHGKIDDRIKSLYYLGRIQYNAEHYQDAITSFTKALGMLDKSEDYKYCGLVNQAIANTYTITYNDEEAIPYMDTAYAYFVKSGNLSLADLTLYTKANALSSLDRYEEADSIFRTIIESENFPESVLPDALSSYALSLISASDEDTGRIEELFSRAVEISGTLPDTNLWGAYAYILAENGKPEMAESIFGQLDDENILLFWKSRVYALSSDYKSAYSMLKKTLAWQEEVVNLKLHQSAVKAQRDYFALEDAAGKITMRNLRLLFMVIMLMFMIVVSAIVLIFRKHHYEIMKEKSELIATSDMVRSQLENEKASRSLERLRYSHELQDKEQTLSMLKAEYIHIYKSQFRQLGTLCETFLRSDAYRDSHRIVYDKVKEMFRDINGDKAGQERFEKMINSSLNDVMKHFREDFPSFSEEDCRFVSYVIAGFDATTMSVILRMPSQAAVYMKKSRIKKQISASTSEYKAQYLELFN